MDLPLAIALNNYVYILTTRGAKVRVYPPIKKQNTAKPVTKYSASLENECVVKKQGHYNGGMRILFLYL